MKLETKITTGAISLLAIVAIVMGANLIGQDNVYYCEDRQIAMQCDKLSGTNSEGLQTRCYFFSEELNRDTYKMCKTGWFEFVNNENTYNYNDTDFVCDEGELVKECRADDGQVILRIRNE